MEDCRAPSLLSFLLRPLRLGGGEGAMPSWSRCTATGRLQSCRNPWSRRKKQELIQRARHVGHRQGTSKTAMYNSDVPRSMLVRRGNDVAVANRSG